MSDEEYTRGDPLDTFAHSHSTLTRWFDELEALAEAVGASE